MAGTITRGKALRADLAIWDGKTSTATRLDATGGTITGLAIGNEVDVLQVYGAGTSRTRASMAAAVQQIGTAKVTLVFAPGTWTIDDNLTIPSNFTCHVPAGCIFDVTSGKTLTFSGPLQRESETWTSGSGSVSYTPANNVLLHTRDFWSQTTSGRTAAEVLASITPTNYAYPPLNVLRYGADLTGVADSATAFNNASLVASYGSGDTVVIPAGTYKIASTILFYTTPNLGRVIFQGAGKVGTTLNYTGAASAVGVSVASTRIYDCGMRDLTLVNSGSVAGLVGLDLDSVSTSHFTNLSINSFPTAVREHSTINGGCVYNRFYNVTAQMGATPTVGFLVDAKGSNATEFLACRYNGPNATVGTAWKIVDASGCSVIASNIDLALVGYDLSAPSGAGYTDSNAFIGNRNEGLGTCYSLAANVRWTHIANNHYETVTTLISDSGTRNNLWDPPRNSFEQYTDTGQATGTKRIVNTSDIGANPFTVIADTATTTVGSTVLQVDTSSLNQTLIRARTASADKFTVSGAGDLGLHGRTPAAQITGFGTPTGTGVIINFPGATATLAQCSQAIAQLITDLKSLGLYGA